MCVQALQNANAFGHIEVQAKIKVTWHIAFNPPLIKCLCRSQIADSRALKFQSISFMSTAFDRIVVED